jgi:hypothetical protein
MKLVSYPVWKMVTPEPKPQSDPTADTLSCGAKNRHRLDVDKPHLFQNMKHVTNGAASSTEPVHDIQDILVIVENIQAKYCYTNVQNNTLYITASVHKILHTLTAQSSTSYLSLWCYPTVPTFCSTSLLRFRFLQSWLRSSKWLSKSTRCSYTCLCSRAAAALCAFLSRDMLQYHRKIIRKELFSIGNQ